MKLCIIYDDSTKQILGYGKEHDTILGGANITVDLDDELFSEFDKNCTHFKYDNTKSPSIVKSDDFIEAAKIALDVQAAHDRLQALDVLRSGQALDRFLIDDDKSGLQAIYDEAEKLREFIRKNSDQGGS